MRPSFIVSSWVLMGALLRRCFELEHAVPPVTMLISLAGLKRGPYVPGSALGVFLTAEAAKRNRLQIARVGCLAST